MERNEYVPIDRRYAMTQMVPVITAGMVEAQRTANLWLSMQYELLALSPKCPWIMPKPVRPWWRLDLRIPVWMEEWDERFAGRYSR